MAKGRVPTEPGEGVVCLVCGDEMRTIAPHVRVHGLTVAQYRKRFPGAPITGEIFRAIKRDYAVDRQNAGNGLPKGKYEMCRKGLHRMTGRNVYLWPDGITRTCRACRKEKMKQHRARTRKTRAEIQRAYYKRNREARLAYHRAWLEKNRDKMNAQRRKARKQRKKGI